MSDLSNTILNGFPRKKIVIIGDLVADQFLRGTISRVSREAPVFILSHDETETFAGGAANAAVNVAALGGKAILIGVVGEDENGKDLIEKLESANVECGFVTASAEVKTTTKVRVLAGQHYAPRQQVIRVDYENKKEIGAKLKNELRKNFLKAAQNADAIIISDYSYGAANAETGALAVKIAKEKNIPLLIDSRFRLKDFPGATSATPNQDEVEQILGKRFSEADCAEFCKNLGYESLLITRGNLGMLLIEKGKKPLSISAVGSKEPVDVTGAGDTVIAAFALALASGLSFAEAANLANHAGGIVVMKKGTAAAGADELISSLANKKPLKSQSKSR